MCFYLQRCLKVYQVIVAVSLLLLGNTVAANIVIKHNPPINNIEQALLDDMQNSPTVQQALRVLQKTVSFPKVLEIVYGETPKNAARPGPYYSRGKISIPYKYIFQMRKYLNKRKHIHQYRDVDQLVFASLVFAFLHEAGHALIDQHNIPVIGREEDSVDNFASYLLLSKFPNGRELLTAAAVVFDLQSRTGKNITNKQMQGEHRLNKQRYYSLLCYLYGHNVKETPIKYQQLFTQDRLLRCVRDYQQLNVSWRYIINSIQ